MQAGVSCQGGQSIEFHETSAVLCCSQLRQSCVRSVARLTAAAGAHSAPQGAEACWRHHRHWEDRRVCWGPLARSLHGCAAMLPVVRTSLHNDVLAGTELVASVVRTLRLNPSPCRRAARHRCPRPAWCCGRCRCDWRGGGSPEHCAQLGAHPHPVPRCAPSAVTPAATCPAASWCCSLLCFFKHTAEGWSSPVRISARAGSGEPTGVQPRSSLSRFCEWEASLCCWLGCCWYAVGRSGAA